jgi:hypothetical protein
VFKTFKSFKPVLNESPSRFSTSKSIVSFRRIELFERIERLNLLMESGNL